MPFPCVCACAYVNVQVYVRACVNVRICVRACVCKRACVRVYVEIDNIHLILEVRICVGTLITLCAHKHSCTRALTVLAAFASSSAADCSILVLTFKTPAACDSIPALSCCSLLPSMEMRSSPIASLHDRPGRQRGGHDSQVLLHQDSIGRRKTTT